MYDIYTPVVLATSGSTSTPTWMGDLSTAFSGVTSTAESIGGLVVPVIVGVMAVVIGIKLLKKFGNKIG